MEAGVSFPGMADTSADLVVVMGVSGSGKSAVGAALAVALGLPYVDGDALHPPENVAKMHAGVPLADDDRWPWLDTVGEWLRAHAAGGGVVACSALRRSYRDRLLSHAPTARFAELDVPPDVLRARLAARTGHFMPASLLDSQLATLEPLAEDEPGVRVQVRGEASVEENAARLQEALA